MFTVLLYKLLCPWTTDACGELFEENYLNQAGSRCSSDTNWHKPKSRKYRKSQPIWNFYVIWAILEI